MMKKLQLIIAVIAIVFLSGCEKNELFIEPIADFDISTGETGVLFSPVTFKITGQGNRITLFTGDPGSDFDKGDVGVVLKPGDTYRHIYATVGTFDVVLLVSSFNERGQDLVKKVTKKQITITSGDDFISAVERVRLTFKGASIPCYADKVTGLAKNYTLTEQQLITFGDVVEDGGNYNCVAFTHYYNRNWADVQLFPGLPIFEPHRDKYKIALRTVNSHSGISVRVAEAYRLENKSYTLLTDTLINVDRTQVFWFNKSVESGVADGGYKPIKLTSDPGLASEVKDYNVYVLPYPEMKSFRIGTVTKTGNANIRLNPTGATLNQFYSIFKLAENPSLVPTFSTVLSPNVVVTDKTGKVIKGDGTDDPINFFGDEPVTFTLTYTDPDFPEGYNQSVSYYTVYIE